VAWLPGGREKAMGAETKAIKAHRDPSDSLRRFKLLFYRISLSQNRCIVLQNAL
jgi:hypothetical protein